MGEIVVTRPREKEGKPTSESAIEYCKLELFPENINPNGVIFGGRILELVSEVASQVANSHTEKKCNTMGIDFIRYYSPIKRGDIIICKASVNHVWERSLEIGVKVIGEDFRLLETKNILSAYFTFVSLDENANPVELNLVIPQSDEDMRRYNEAEKRRSIRLKRAI